MLTSNFDKMSREIIDLTQDYDDEHVAPYEMSVRERRLARRLQPLYADVIEPRVLSYLRPDEHRLYRQFGSGSSETAYYGRPVRILRGHALRRQVSPLGSTTPARPEHPHVANIDEPRNEGVSLRRVNYRRRGPFDLSASRTHRRRGTKRPLY